MNYCSVPLACFSVYGQDFCPRPLNRAPQYSQKPEVFCRFLFLPEPSVLPLQPRLFALWACYWAVIPDFFWFLMGLLYWISLSGSHSFSPLSGSFSIASWETLREVDVCTVAYLALSALPHSGAAARCLCSARLALTFLIQAAGPPLALQAFRAFSPRRVLGLPFWLQSCSFSSGKLVFLLCSWVSPFCSWTPVIQVFDL